MSEILGNKHTTLATLSHALAVYDAIRRPFAQEVARKSRENGILLTLNHPALRFDRPEDQDENTKMRRLSEVRLRVKKNWEWAWETTVDADIQRALALLVGSANGS